MRRANTAKDKPGTTMTRFFMTSIAALLLTTGQRTPGRIISVPLGRRRDVAVLPFRNDGDGTA